MKKLFSELKDLEHLSTLIMYNIQYGGYLDQEEDILEDILGIIENCPL